MVCDDVKRILYFYLDGQLGDLRAREFMAHLGDCPDCDRRLVIQKRLRSFIARRLSVQQVCPDSLRSRLHEAFQTIRTGSAVHQ